MLCMSCGSANILPVSQKNFPHNLCGVQILSTVLLWNFALTNQLNRLPSKVKKDFVPTLVNGEHWMVHWMLCKPNIMP